VPTTGPSASPIEVLAASEWQNEPDTFDPVKRPAASSPLRRHLLSRVAGELDPRWLPRLTPGSYPGYGAIRELFERPRELRARRNSELPINVCEMTFNRSRRNEKRLRNLAVGQSFGCHPRYSTFTRGQRIATR
jgi:hypothetical protein